MIARWQNERLKTALKDRRGVHLTGARQCGKTTLAESLPIANAVRFTFDDATARSAAAKDPLGFVMRKAGTTMVIDEVQKVAPILDAIKMQVDHCAEKAQYLLTGSSNLRFAKAVKDSLAGRFATIRLRTLTRGEINGGRGDFLGRAFHFDFPAEIKGYDKRAVISLAFQGGYPETLDYSESARLDWFNDYLNDILQKDIQEVTEIRKLDALRKVSDWLLAYSARFFDVKSLATAAGIGVETVENYLAALKTLYLFDGVDPWTKSDYVKIGKRTKYFAADPALTANLLGWREEQVYFDDDKSGKLIETWVYHELAALKDLNPLYKLTQYRDSAKREIDFLIENGEDGMLGIEVKAGSVVGQEDFSNMKWFAQNLAKVPFKGIVLYSGDKTLPFGENFRAVPLGALAL